MSSFDTDTNKIQIYGESVVTNGLSVRDGINGIGLVTRGVLWQLFDIYIDTGSKDGIVSSWSNSDASITTTWSNSDSAISTTWTNEQYGIYGEYNP